MTRLPHPVSSTSPIVRRSMHSRWNKKTPPPGTPSFRSSGTTYDTLAAVMDQDAAEQTMQVNYWAFARIARAVVRPMLRARYGRIVVIGSVMGLQASQGNAVLCAQARPHCCPMCARWRSKPPGAASR